jgi:hypothetical protein
MERCAGIVDCQRVIGMELSCRSYFGFVKVYWWTPAHPAAVTSRSQTRLRSFMILSSLELREGRKNVEDQFP